MTRRARKQKAIPVARPATKIRRLIDSDPTTAATATLRTVVPPSAETVCCRPGCPEKVTWSPQKGRRPRFCSDQCRNLFGKERGRLLEELAEYRRLVAECPMSWVQSVEVDGRIALVRLQLDRYRSFE